jgi:hypothetical protein
VYPALKLVSHHALQCVAVDGFAGGSFVCDVVCQLVDLSVMTYIRLTRHSFQQCGTGVDAQVLDVVILSCSNGFPFVTVPQ